jgi:hypothetical protein
MRHDAEVADLIDLVSLAALRSMRAKPHARPRCGCAATRRARSGSSAGASPHVLRWQRAAIAAWTYYLGGARTESFGKPFIPTRLIDGPFSLDWFRRPPQVPGTWTADRLAIVAESTFERTFANPDRAAGTYFYSSGRIRGQFWFRTDFAKVCLYAAEVTVG